MFTESCSDWRRSKAWATGACGHSSKRTEEGFSRLLARSEDDFGVENPSLDIFLLIVTVSHDNYV